MASFSFILPEDGHYSIKDNAVNSGWISMVTQLNTLEGPESESQNIRQSFAEILGDKYHYANAINSSLLWTVGYTPYIPPVLKGRSFPSVESFFLDEWEPLTLQQTPQVLSTSVSIKEDNLNQSSAGLVSQVLSTSVAIMENDLIQSAAGLVSQVLSTSVSIVENDLIHVSIVENDRFQSATNLVSQDEDSTLRASNQPEVHVADVSTKGSRLTITISMGSTKSSHVALREVDASATSLEQSAEKMSTSTTDVNDISSTAAAKKKKRCGLFSSLWRALRGKNKKPAKVASKKEDEINKDESRLTCHHNTIQGDH
ncbi:uncharacterized protein LOC121532520 [Coregonus clupeaformis]|uniref:uncharacterized protein LOC121532520 n=1 Tax=Coregonus clupeaformis TaxID=59861 RepID=UPI001E1C61FF|nr:uncharacterized protein LOC121532520 [Coregonus clupeaformis]